MFDVVGPDLPVGALVPPVLALLNLTDDEPANPLDEYDPEEVIDRP